MLIGLAIFCASITIVVCILHYLIRCGRTGKLIDKIPGPYAWPLIGNVAKYLVPLDQLWGVLRRMNAQYYPICRFWSAHSPVVHVIHPDDVEAILSSTKNITKSQFYDFLQPWLGTGLLTSTGAKWHRRRKILTPAFHFKVLQQFMGIFVEQSEKLADSLCLEGDEVVPSLVSLLHKYTINSISETAMGSRSDVDGTIIDEYRSNVFKMGDIFLHRIIRPWLYPDYIYKFFKKHKEQVQVLKVLHEFTTNIINERKRYHEETGGQYLKGLDGSSNRYSIGEEEVEGRRRLAMLDLLISAQKEGANIDDLGIREEVDTIMFEGHDTTAAALCFILLLLAENKEAQNKARAEVDSIFQGREKDKLSLGDIRNLSYVERCIKESLRLFPSVPVISRHTSEDLQLKNYMVPEGTIMHIFIWDLHRDPNFWPNPEVFDPDRFLPDQIQGRHPFAYVPFSAGSRNCIGQKFAMMELKTLVGTLLKNFYLEPIDSSREVGFVPDLVLRPLNPIRIKFIRRSHDN